MSEYLKDVPDDQLRQNTEAYIEYLYGRQEALDDHAKFLLGWRPEYDLSRVIDGAWDYQRAADDPRVIWYPG